MSSARPLVQLALDFIDHINRRDPAGLRQLMSDDHRLEVFDDDPLIGEEANASAWRGYFDGFPRYRIHPHRVAEHDGRVAILGHTTGSHLGLPDDEESRLTLIWIADVAGGSVTRWRLIDDDEPNRRAFGLA